MARTQLPRNAGTPDGETGAPIADPRRKVPIYGNHIRVRTGGYMWTLSGLENLDIFPSPNKTGWACGQVPYATRMAMREHPKIAQATNNLKNAIVGDGGRWIPAVNPYGPDKSFFKEALKYAQFMEDNSRHIYGSTPLTARQMLECIVDGNKVAAWSLSERTWGRNKGKAMLDALNIFPSGRYHFYRDEFGTTTEIRTSNNLEQDRWSRDKFLVLSWRPVDRNPYGTTVYAPAYSAYYEDIQSQYEQFAYMSTFGRPSVIIFAAPPPDDVIANEQPVPLVFANGEPVMEPDPDNPGQLRQREGYQTEQNKLLFTEFRSGSIWSMEAGSLVQVVEARPGGAELFLETRREAGRNMVGAIYGTHQLTEAQGNVSANNQEVGEGVAGLNVTEGKLMLEQAEENDLARQILPFNFGDNCLDLLPIRDYGSGQNNRLPRIMNSQVGFASNGSMTRAQYWDFCAGNGLPLPWPDDEPVVFAMRKVTGTGGGDKTGVDPGKPQGAPAEPPPTTTP